MAAPAAKKLTVDDVNKTLENSLKNIFESDRFKDLLNVMANTKNYSLNNTILIMTQNPESTMVMGYKDWQKLGRHVTKGQKSIKILAPSIKKMEMEKIDPISKSPVQGKDGKVITEEKKVITGYLTVSVFDINQTEGKEIPSVRDFTNRNMAEDEYMSKLYHDYKAFLTESKGMVIDEATTDGSGGYYVPSTNEIVISTNVNQNDTQKFRVLVHEYAHAQLHNKQSEMHNLPRGHKEAQAESVAFVVNKYFGLDTSDISTGYIATWAADIKLAKQALGEIQKNANFIIDEIELLQKEKIKSFYTEQSKDYEEAKAVLTSHWKVPEKAFDPSTKEVTQLQLINKDNGIILSGKLEYSEKQDNYYLRTNRNLIEPLSDLSKNGKLAVLNVEKNLDKIEEISEYNRIPDQYTVRKIRNGPYVVQSTAGKDIISKGFEKKADAEHFKLRASIGQSLHQKSFFNAERENLQLKDEMIRIVSVVESQINSTVGDYLSHHSNADISIVGPGGAAVGWALLKNPAIRDVDQLNEFAEKNKYIPSYKGLQEAIVHSNKKENSERERELNIER
ncbi:ArdC family protein [Bacillus sp. 1P06AnD]|uniref:ArdC family protein n=1 Tax=Bacillus sp. 1P06AnD TaxID=3132208 RepID=UPI0039A03E08